MTTLVFDIIGNDVSGSQALKNVGDASDEAGRKLKTFGDEGDNAAKRLAALGPESDTAANRLKAIGVSSTLSKDGLRALGEESASAGQKIRGLGDDSDKSKNKLSSFGTEANKLKDIFRGGLIPNLAPFVIPAVNSIGQLTGALALVPSVALGAGTALAAVAIGTRGVADAFKAAAPLADLAAKAASANAAAHTAQAAAVGAASTAGNQHIAVLKQAVAQGAANVASLQAQNAGHTGTTAAIKSAQAAQLTNVAALKQAQAAQTGNTAALNTSKTAQQNASSATAKAKSAQDAYNTALDKYKEALADLSPSARAFVLSALALKPAFDELKLDVQQKLFEGLGVQMTDLGTTALPVVRTGLVGMATALNESANNVANFAKSKAAVADYATVFDNISTAGHLLAASVKPILQIFTDLSVVGSQFLPGLAVHFAEAAQRAADFVSRARETGQLRAWIQQGTDACRVLWGIFKDLVAIVKVFVNPPGGGHGLLDLIKDITGSVRWFLENVPHATGLVEAFVIAWRLAPVVSAIKGLITIIMSLTVAEEAAGVAAGGAATATEAAASRMAGAWKLGAVAIGAYVVGLGLLAVGQSNTGTGFKDMAKDAADTAGKLLTLNFGGIVDKIGRDINRLPDDVDRMKARWGPVWDGLVAAPTDFGTSVKGVIDSVLQELSGFGSSVSAEIDKVVNFFKALPGRIVSAVGNLGGTLVAAGQAAIQGLFKGLSDWWSQQVVPWLKARAADIANLKGPVGKDRQLLVPHGMAIMEGLHAGMQDRWAGIADWLRGLGGQMSGHVGSGATGGVLPPLHGVLTDMTRAADFGGGSLASIRSATHGVSRLATYGEVPTTSQGPPGGGGQPGPVRIHIGGGGTPLEQLILELLRQSIRLQGGNVQLVLGAA